MSTEILMSITRANPYVYLFLGMLFFPTPVFGQTEQPTLKQLDQWWEQLGLRGPDGTAAALNFRRYPEVMARYFDEQLNALMLNKEEFDRLIRDLGSDDEETWQAAYHELADRDPRISWDVETIMQAVSGNPQRNRMVAVLSNHSVESFQLDERNYFSGSIGLRADGGELWFEIKKTEHTHLWSTASDLNAWRGKPTGRRLDRAMLLLATYRSTGSMGILQRMSEGNKDAHVTRSALEYLSLPTETTAFDAVRYWNTLGHHGNHVIAIAIRMMQHPDESVRLFAGLVRPVALCEMEFETLLEELASDDKETWQQAYQEFRFLDPRIYADVETLLSLVPENPARIRMIGILVHWKLERLEQAVTTHLHVDDIQFRKHDTGNYYLATDRNGMTWSAYDNVAQTRVVNEFRMPEWKRITHAVAILEQIGTPEAVKIIKDVADGSDNAAPTIFAQKVRERMKVLKRMKERE